MKQRKAKPRKDILELIYSDEELCQLVDWCMGNWTDPYWQGPVFYVLLILCTGLRRTEARLLRVEHCVTAPFPLIHVANAKGGHNRSVEILPHFESLYLQRIEELRLSGQPYVFSGRRWKDPPADRTVAYWWQDVMRAVGIRELAPHTGRRCFATYAPKIPFPDENGIARYIAPTDLQAQLGHADFKMTAEYYVKSIPGARFPRNGKSWAPQWPERIKQ